MAHFVLDYYSMFRGRMQAPAASSPSQALCASSPKGGAFDKIINFVSNAKASPFGRGGIASAMTERVSPLKGGDIMPKVLRTLPERGFRRRARAVAVLFCAVCLGLAVRLFFLQVRTDGFYADRAQGQQLRDTVVPADRGRIYSADGLLLAANSSCWTLRASPREMPEEKITLAAHGLAEILALDEAALTAAIDALLAAGCTLLVIALWRAW